MGGLGTKKIGHLIGWGDSIFEMKNILMWAGFSGWEINQGPWVWNWRRVRWSCDCHCMERNRDYFCGFPISKSMFQIDLGIFLWVMFIPKIWGLQHGSRLGISLSPSQSLALSVESQLLAYAAGVCPQCLTQATPTHGQQKEAPKSSGFVQPGEVSEKQRESWPLPSVTLWMLERRLLVHSDRSRDVGHRL